MARDSVRRSVQEWSRRRSSGLKKLAIGILAALLLLCGIFLLWRQSITEVTITPEHFSDVARLYPTEVARVEREDKVEGLKAAIDRAKREGLKVSIAGSRHSQGGHTYYPDAVVLDMRSFNAIKMLDVNRKLLTVESGATWEEIQEYIAPHGLAVQVMQSSYVFTVGGSLSANAHGRGLDKTTVVETVRSFRLLKADGEVVNVSRTENPELFRLVVGGYGLFGVILDVTLELTDDETYEKRSVEVGYREFPSHFASTVQADGTAEMMLVRPSIDPGSENFMRNLIVSTWHSTDYQDGNLHELQGEKNVLRDQFIFDLSRRYDWAKSVRWWLQKNIVEKGGADYVTRNNAMRPPTAPLDFLDYRPRNKTDIIQEYYIPVDNFEPFMDEFRRILLEDEVNVISSTIRYVKANDEVHWSHTPDRDSFAIIVMSNIGLDDAAVTEAEQTTHRLMDAALRNDGRHYLTYQLFPTREQLRKAYTKTGHVFEQKKVYDKNELFMSNFYEYYALGREVERN